MGLLNDLKPLHHGKPCKIGAILNELEPEDAHILDEALRDLQKWSNRALAHALQARGISVVTDTIRAHRLNTCPCRRLA
jgi:N-acetylglucosamine-6-phosphate deacetylase